MALFALGLTSMNRTNRDGMSLDAAFFLAIIRIAPNAPKYLREKAYRGRVHHVKLRRSLSFRHAVR